jgi:type IV secretory pathway VirB10-like protein
MSISNDRPSVLSDFDSADARPRVAMPARPWVMPLAIACAFALGLFVLWQMSEGRARSAAAQQAPPPPAPIILAQAPPQPLPLPAPPVEAPMASAMMQPPPPPTPDADLVNRLSSRAMVVDLSEPGRASAANGEEGAAVNPRDVTDAVAGRDDAFGQGSNEIFASRLGRNAAEARARPAGDLSNIVPEGSVIPAVLETALNSDLPGYTRAIVSRDVLSFDGTKVLAPRGSRLVGQYRSAVALGQSRAFVIWTRLIRPDGVNIQLAEPGTDALGRGGLEGEVDTHFLRRFGGAILLSLITVGANAAAADTQTQVIIAGASGASDALTSEMTRGANVAPTVDVAQGTPIRIFVTRDLDFSGVSAP